jgi:hypothetical protein
MGSFFAKSGNSRGFFPDSSIEEEKSLFTNDDEKGPDCPCAIEDNPQSPTSPTSCEPAEPVYDPVELEDFEVPNVVLYRMTIGSNVQEGYNVTWIDEAGNPQSYIVPQLKGGLVQEFCAEEWSIEVDGNSTIFIDPVGCQQQVCQVLPGLSFEFLGPCPN